MKTIKSPPKFTPILIHEDRKALEELLTLGNRACRAMSAVQQAYKALRLGPWSQEAYDAATGPGLALLERKELERVEGQYEALPFRSATVRREMTESVTNLFSALRETVKALRKAAEPPPHLSRPPFPVELLKINDDGSAAVPESVKEEILEKSCRTYVTNAEDAAVYQRVVALEEAANGFLESARERKPERFYDIWNGLHFSQFLHKQEDKTVKVNANAIAWLIKK